MGGGSGGFGVKVVTNCDHMILRDFSPAPAKSTSFLIV